MIVFIQPLSSRFASTARRTSLQICADVFLYCFWRENNRTWGNLKKFDIKINFSFNSEELFNVVYTGCGWPIQCSWILKMRASMHKIRACTTRAFHKQFGLNSTKGPVIKYGKGGGMEEKLGPPSKIICLFKAPLMHFILFRPPLPLVPLENIVLYWWLARLGQSLGEQVINEEY